MKHFGILRKTDLELTVYTILVYIACAIALEYFGLIKSTIAFCC